MKTIYWKIDDPGAQPDEIAQAAEIIRNGGLVAIPTETVYGLGANGLDAQAVRKIFEAKGRPQDNPLILHIAERSQLEEICRELGEGAIAADPFWRGPDKNACRYCDYAAACHFEEGRGGDCRRWAHKLAAADFWTEVDGGKKHD